MKSHGILMSDEMVRQYLAGVKTQTRRTRGLDVINKNPSHWICRGRSSSGDHFIFDSLPLPDLPRQNIKPPYGLVDDELWFKEVFQVVEPHGSVGDEWIGDEWIEIDGRLPKEKPENLGFWLNVLYRADEPDLCSWWRT